MSWPGRLGTPSVSFCFSLWKILFLKAPLCHLFVKLIRVTSLRLLLEDIFCRLKVHLHNFLFSFQFFDFPLGKSDAGSMRWYFSIGLSNALSTTEKNSLTCFSSLRSSFKLILFAAVWQWEFTLSNSCTSILAVLTESWFSKIQSTVLYICYIFCSLSCTLVLCFIQTYFVKWTSFHLHNFLPILFLSTNFIIILSHEVLTSVKPGTNHCWNPVETSMLIPHCIL